AIFPAADAPETGAVRYAPSAATRPARDDSAVRVHALIADPGDDGDAAEARRVLDIIRSAQREAPAESIAVLVRARSHLAALVAEIRRSAPELRFQAVDIEGLDDRQHVQDLLTLFRALHHRADRVHWLALLRAPWCGLTLADLHALAGDDHHSTVWQLMHDEPRLARLSADGQARLRQVREVLHLVFAGRDRQHLRRWLEAAWLLLGGPRCLESPAALADVEAFFALLDRLAAAGRLDAETLAARSGELFAPADPLGGAVQMMTVHKSKGLEFDTVILPGLHHKTAGNDSSLLLWDEVVVADGGEHLLVAPLKARGSEAGEATAYDYLQRLENTRAGHEDERLLYVAATRAIRRLHLIGVAVADADKEDGLKPPPAGSLLRLLWPAVAQPVFVAALAEGTAAVSTFQSPALAAPLPPRGGGAGGEGEATRETAAGSSIALACATEEGVAGKAPFFGEPPPLPNPSPARGEGLQQNPAAPLDSATFVPPLLRLAALGIPDELRMPPAADGSGGMAREPDAPGATPTAAAALGTLVHRALEWIARDGPAAWPASRVEALAPAWQGWLQAQGQAPEVASAAAGEAVAAVCRTLASSTGRWLLAGHAEAGAEQAWSSRDADGNVAHHVIDRCFIADGCRWIVDYKTVHLPADELAARAASFRPQLERYAALFADDAPPLRLAIYFPLQDRLVELD
ncbi:MAG: PD-(D/E)XK nuclease family protein, partial [Betaproteobacteria bacterium]|nr:PD-(D/E)XK nuclease family protein [Betaproteobacteria bacterium]